MGTRDGSQCAPLRLIVGFGMAETIKRGQRCIDVGPTWGSQRETDHRHADLRPFLHSLKSFQFPCSCSCERWWKGRRIHQGIRLSCLLRGINFFSFFFSLPPSFWLTVFIIIITRDDRKCKFKLDASFEEIVRLDGLLSFLRLCGNHGSMVDKQFVCRLLLDGFKWVG